MHRQDGLHVDDLRIGPDADLVTKFHTARDEYDRHIASIKPTAEKAKELNQRILDTGNEKDYQAAQVAYQETLDQLENIPRRVYHCSYKVLTFYLQCIADARSNMAAALAQMEAEPVSDDYTPATEGWQELEQAFRWYHVDLAKLRNQHEAMKYRAVARNATIDDPSTFDRAAKMFAQKAANEALHSCFGSYGQEFRLI